MIANAIEIAPAVAPPNTELIITRTGSAATNGNAPSEIKHKPNTNEALPASRWLVVNLLRAIKVAIAIPIGGTIPAAITAAIGVYCCEAIKPTPNVYAALFTGPPISIHIIAPRIAPKIIAFA